MPCFKILLCVAVALASSGCAEPLPSFIRHPREAAAVARQVKENDIPQLCIDQSVTPVSCTEDAVGPDGLLPHPDDCRLFYYCVAPGWPAICRLCPAGLHFNPNKHVCDTVEDACC